MRPALFVACLVVLGVALFKIALNEYRARLTDRRVVAGPSAVVLADLIEPGSSLHVESGNRFEMTLAPDSAAFQELLAVLQVAADPLELSRKTKRALGRGFPHIAFVQNGAERFRIYYAGLYDTVYVHAPNDRVHVHRCGPGEMDKKFPSTRIVEFASTH